MAEERLEGVIALKDQATSVLKNVAGSMKELRTVTKSLKEALGDVEKPKVDDSQVKKTEDSMKKLGDETQKAEKKTSSLKKVLGTLAVGATLKSIITQGVQYNAMLETSQAAWETLLGSEKAATDQMNALVKMGAETPYDFAGLDSAAKKLSMAGYSGQALMETLRNVGDAVSAIGGGQQELESVSTALFQIYTKGKLSSEEMLQLAERGIPAWEILADKMGVTTAELQDMTSKGKLLSTEVLPMLTEGLGERFGGSMQKQAQTFNGLVSTLKDNLNQLGGEATAGIFDGLKDSVHGVLDEMQRLTDTGELRSAMKTISSVVGGVVSVVGKTLGVLWDMRSVIAVVAISVGAYKVATSAATIATKLHEKATKALAAAQSATPWGMIAAAVGAVVGVIGMLTQAYEQQQVPLTKVKDALNETTEAYEDAKKAASDSYSDQIADVKVMESEVERVNKLLEARGVSNYAKKAAIDELIKQFPELEDAVKRVNGQWTIQREKVDDVIAGMEEEIRLELERANLKAAIEQQNSVNATLEEAKTARADFISSNQGIYNDYVTKGANLRSAEDSLKVAQATGDQEAISFAQQNVEIARTIYEAAAGAFLPFQQAVEEAQQAKYQADMEVEAVRNRMSGVASPEAEAATTSLLNNVMEPMNGVKDGIMELNGALAEISKGTGGDIARGLRIAGASDSDIANYGGSMEAAKGFVEQKMIEVAQSAFDQSVVIGDEILSDYGDQLSATEELMLTNYLETVRNGLKAGSDDFATAISWLKSWTLPVDVTIHGNGTTTYGGTTTTTAPTSAPSGHASGTNYFIGGETRINEQGGEVVELPTGTRIYPARDTERLTRQANSPAQIYISGNNFTVREEADIDKIATALMNKLSRASLVTA